MHPIQVNVSVLWQHTHPFLYFFQQIKLDQQLETNKFQDLLKTIKLMNAELYGLNTHNNFPLLNSQIMILHPSLVKISVFFYCMLRSCLIDMIGKIESSCKVQEAL
ncbi:hypothetical protein FGO68_gene3390 [Halteria grandinella]|uniref:Uncharacterized protein n=1 Tax=Halteria grandinella TaxID=5974 RepID=A0A8J8NEZ4_HALGN|nr:hypothetical protein FGO68_gene3390 [Halteria grandinella]